jgi:hypothetical protein
MCENPLNGRAYAVAVVTTPRSSRLTGLTPFTLTIALDSGVRVEFEA